MSPSRKRTAVDHQEETFEVSERRACEVIDQPRSTQRYVPRPASDEATIVTRMLELVRVHPRFGYRRVAVLLKREGFSVNLKRVYRLWRREGLKVPRKQRKQRCLGQSANGCQRHRSERRNLESQQIVPSAFDHFGRNVLLAAHRVNGDCRPFQVEHFQQQGNRRDFIGFCLGGDLAQRQPNVTRPGRNQMQRILPGRRVERTSQRFPVDANMFSGFASHIIQPLDDTGGKFGRIEQREDPSKRVV